MMVKGSKTLLPAIIGQETHNNIMRSYLKVCSIKSEANTESRSLQVNT